MFRNNLKIAWRALHKNSLYSLISIVGLSAGIAASLLIYQIVSYEYGFNKNFNNYDRIGRVVRVNQNAEEGRGYTTCLPIPAMELVEQNIAEFEKVARVKETWSAITVPDPVGDIPLRKFAIPDQSTAFFAQSSFFAIFEVPWIEGDPATCLDEPSTIVLSKSYAEKCFDASEDVVGKTVLIDNLIPATVKGVYEDFPPNCDFNSPFFISYPTLQANAEMFFYQETWGDCSSNNQVYALLKNQDLAKTVDLSLKEIGKEEYTNEIEGQRSMHQFQPLSDLHYDENYYNSGDHRTSKSRLKILSGIGLLILLMACFNFINLTTAQSSLRSKEVGVRKTLGSTRPQLTGQFLIETAMIVAGSVLLGMALASLASPLLQYISDVPVGVPFLKNSSVLIFLLITAIGVTLISGLYPALALSRYKPIDAIKHKVVSKGLGGIAVRKALVILQFTIAQALIIAAIINIMQLDYIKTRDLGFAKDLVYTFNLNVDSLTLSKHNALKSKLQALSTVKSVSLSSDQPQSGNTWASNFRFANRPEDERYAINMKFCDEDYLHTYGLRLKAGRWLMAADTMREAVLNQTALNRLGITHAEEALNQIMTLGRRQLKIVGILEDFHQHSLKNNYQPLVMTTRKDMYWEVGLKVSPQDIAGTTAAINRIFDEVLPEQIFDGKFLDESIARFYRDDQRLSSTTKFFGFLAIFISCLGLFGLATHAAAQRIKEIGVRKILGASISNIVLLLSKDFIAMVGLALLVASPAAFYLMSQWLDNFVFRIPMPWWVFIATGLLAMIMALVTVSIQGIRAAVVNPIESLRDE